MLTDQPVVAALCSVLLLLLERPHKLHKYFCPNGDAATKNQEEFRFTVHASKIIGVPVVRPSHTITESVLYCFSKS